MQADFDLTPDPRILPMLGEINLSQERCIAELIDNSVDGFLQDKRGGALNYKPEIVVNLPSGQSESARITITDNGPGMSTEVLEKAVKAGWTNNDPIRNLGLFGMGFNIATARLGRVTSVYTSRAGDAEKIGLTIDFEELMEKKTFKTKVQRHVKTDPSQSGTTIVIERLKPDQLAWFSKGANVSKLIAFFARVYSSMLRDGGDPISFSLSVNGKRVLPKIHCVWSAERFSQTTSVGPVAAMTEINASGSIRPFCTRCWHWLSVNQAECPQCEKGDKLESRKRVIRGWVGIQRYLDESDYGIDFIRNGRKIEIGNKDLFFFERNGVLEKEYPIDDPRDRGRIVGEIHIDHCRVSYTKDKFDRDDPAWFEMVMAIKGDGPLRPELAKDLGFSAINAPLFKLFQAFRRSTPKPKVAGCWKRLLVLSDNNKAQEYARRFDARDSMYLSDSEWYKFIEKDDELLQLNPGIRDDGSGTTGGTGTVNNPFTDNNPPGTAVNEGSKEDVVPPFRQEIISLSDEYIEDISSSRFSVRCFQVPDEGMPPDKRGEPICFQRSAAGEYEFLVNRDSDQYSSITCSPRSSLIFCLANLSAERHKVNTGSVEFVKIHTALRRKYCAEESLELDRVISRARIEIDSIIRHLKTLLAPAVSREIFGKITSYERSYIFSRLTDGQIDDSVISSARFLNYAPQSLLIRLFQEMAAEFFNGKYWNKAIDFSSGDEAIKDFRDKIIRRYIGFLEDAFWAMSATIDDYDKIDREYKIRVAMSVSLMSKQA